ncbi:heavy metal transporter [Flagellimonas hymeniacidonis]|uniref:Heavy metal transporter n=1 Tax=Flagellimonas hymeniacidonis TaxID=2603628 RepID=A0A5C8VBM7_9FLAO|nr:heavy metal-associated domain-containing protein [Flagellimonas hymeniacidonis]TXN38208.1 heavy metal transporter [Flagellimonas hymeniacidonis]
MKQTYSISGMTCEGCVASVSEKLSKTKGVKGVKVNLENAEARIESKHHLSTSALQSALGSKYIILEEPFVMAEQEVEEKSKWVQLKPLFLIFTYLFGAAILLHFNNWETQEVMLDFMGLFYVVFSFFKFLDLKGFPESFGMYDPLAKLVPAYGWLYPFLELGLGLLFLMRLEVTFALIATVIILGITTVGVTRTLLNKKSIRCACLGTALKLPMTEATFIENAIMLAMASWMLFEVL